MNIELTPLCDGAGEPTCFIEKMESLRALDSHVTRIPVDVARRTALEATAATVATEATAPSAGSSLRSVERAALQAQLKAHRGSRAELAQQLGISERSLYRQLREIANDPDAA